MVGSVFEEEDGDLVVVMEGEVLDEEEDMLAAVMEEIESDEFVHDDGRKTHDAAAVQTMREEAICEMQDDGVFISDDENRTAVGIFPKASYESMLRKLC